MPGLCYGRDVSKKDKLLNRFLSCPADFTYSELKRLLRAYGYAECSAGRTSGSQVAFINRATKHIIRLHKPHPKPFLKKYQLNLIEGELKRKGVIQ